MRRQPFLTLAILGMLFNGVSGGIVQAEASDNEATDFVNNSKPLDEYSLDEQLVTAQRMSRTELETPAAVTVITADQIERAGYRTAYEAIDQQLGAENSSYGGETGQDFGTQTGGITLRGYKGGALVLVNGIPMNLRNSSSTENIPIRMIERIEIVKGAGSTLYGGEAIGGVINVILKKPQGKPGGSISVTAGNAVKKTELSYYDSHVLVDISREWSKDRPHSNAFGLGKPSYTDYWVGRGQKNQLGLALKLTDELSLNYDYTEGNIRRGGTKYTKSHGILKPSTTRFDQQYNDYRQTINLSYAGKENGVKAALGYNYRRTDGRDYIKKIDLKSAGKYDSLVLDLQKAWKLDGDTLIGGYLFKRETGRTFFTNIEAKRTSNAVYASYTKQFTNRFNATFGVRGDFISDDVKNQNVVLPQLQTDYKIDDNTAWYVNIGRAFQMPSIDPVDHEDTGVDLKPEKGWNYETGLKLSRGDESWKIALYHMNMHDKLGWKLGDDDRYYLYNKGDFRNTGIEVEYDRRLSEAWGVKLGVSFSNPEIKDPSGTNEWTQDASRIGTTISLDYHRAKWKGNLTFRYLGDREYYSPSSHASGDSLDVPSKLQLNLNMEYRFDAVNNLKLGIYNILDRDNYSDRYGNLELSRNFRLTFTHDF